MGCGTSSHVVPMAEEANSREQAKNGTKTIASGSHEHETSGPEHDDLPTVVLPDTPAKPRPPLAFEIPMQPLVTAGRRTPPLPPLRLQRLLEQPAPEITLPDIEEKLAEAESRRQMILQQRAASASKRAQKAMKIFSEMDTMDRSHDLKEGSEKYGSTNTLKIPPEPESWTDRNI